MLLCTIVLWILSKTSGFWIYDLNLNQLFMVVVFLQLSRFEFTIILSFSATDLAASNLVITLFTET